MARKCVLCSPLRISDTVADKVTFIMPITSINSYQPDSTAVTSGVSKRSCSPSSYNRDDKSGKMARASGVSSSPTANTHQSRSESDAGPDLDFESGPQMKLEPGKELKWAPAPEPSQLNGTIPVTNGSAADSKHVGGDPGHASGEDREWWGSVDNEKENFHLRVELFAEGNKFEITVMKDSLDYPDERVFMVTWQKNGKDTSLKSRIRAEWASANGIEPGRGVRLARKLQLSKVAQDEICRGCNELRSRLQR